MELKQYFTLKVLKMGPYWIHYGTPHGKSECVGYRFTLIEAEEVCKHMQGKELPKPNAINHLPLNPEYTESEWVQTLSRNEEVLKIIKDINNTAKLFILLPITEQDEYNKEIQVDNIKLRNNNTSNKLRALLYKWNIHKSPDGEYEQLDRNKYIWRHNNGQIGICYTESSAITDLFHGTNAFSTAHFLISILLHFWKYTSSTAK